MDDITQKKRLWPSGGPLIFTSPDLDRPGQPFNNQLPLLPNDSCKFAEGGFWGQFMNPDYLPDDHLLSQALTKSTSGQLSLDDIAMHYVIVQLREELAMMSLRNEDLKDQSLEIYSADYIPAHYLPCGEHCKVALGFFSKNWYDILNEHGLTKNFRNALLNIRFGHRLKISEVEFDVDIRPMDLRLKHRICLPPIMPDHLIYSSDFSCIILHLEAIQ